MTETNQIKNERKYDLEERTLKFAKEVIRFVKNRPRTIANIEILKQLVRASSSVGANYIEANESLSENLWCHTGKDKISFEYKRAFSSYIYDKNK